MQKASTSRLKGQGPTPSSVKLPRVAKLLRQVPPKHLGSTGTTVQIVGKQVKWHWKKELRNWHSIA